MHLVCNKMIPDFAFETVSGHHESFLQELHAQKTVLVFHRFIGCRLCQLGLYHASSYYEKMRGADWEVVFVVQSKVDTARPILAALKVPFPVICDPTGVLYQRFGVEPAAAANQMGNQQVIDAQIAQADRLGLKKGDPEGNPLQLPALFVIDRTGMLCCAHYPRTVYGLPALSELISFE